MAFSELAGSRNPTAAALWVTNRIEPRRLARRISDQVHESNFRGALLLCRRALGAGRPLPESWMPRETETDQEQTYWLRQLLVLVDELRIVQRRASAAV